MHRLPWLPPTRGELAAEALLDQFKWEVAMELELLNVECVAVDPTDPPPSGA